MDSGNPQSPGERSKPNPISLRESRQIIPSLLWETNQSPLPLGEC
jgi:hypothetical protein